jgi:hypothetical protein
MRYTPRLAAGFLIEWMLYGGGTVVTLVVIGLIGWTITRTTRGVLHEAEDKLAKCAKSGLES